MARIDLDRLFAIDGGESYIIKYYPDARESFTHHLRKFKTRTENTASASLKKINGEWGVTDFGSEQKWRNAIMIAMLEEGWDYGQALRDVCAFYDYQDGAVNFAAKPRYEERPAKPDEQEGASTVVPKELTIIEIRTILTDNAWYNLGNTEESRKEKALSLFSLYHLKSLEYYTNVFQGKHLTTYSTDEYPIFYFDEGDFGKIYRPKAAHDKRFRYVGKKPAHFVHGLAQHQAFVKELKKDRYNAEAEPVNEEFQQSPEEVAKEIDRMNVKLPEIIACSGGSDAINTAALGYRVIWMNSESESLSGEDMSAILKIAEKIYNLPDIDKTGKQTGHALANKYLNLLTIWLPEKILRVDKETGKATAKDMRDYLKTHNKKDFERLMGTALPYRFWDSEYSYDDNGKMKMKFGRPLIQYKFNHVQAYNFLYMSGFARFKSERDKEGFFYVRVEGNVVRKIDAQEIKGYLHSFLKERWQYDDNVTQDLLNSMFSTNQLSISNLANLPLLDLDFQSSGPEHQYLFFPNCTWKVTKDGIDESKGINTNKYVWEDKVITYPVKDSNLPRIKKTDSMFKISRDPEGALDIEITNKDCMFFRFLINTARVHWRKELEDRQALWMTHDTPKKRETYIKDFALTEEETTRFFATRSIEEQDKYKEDHKFDIAGPLLTEQEKKEQKQHLLNRIYTIGYMMHRYKDPSRAWCVWAMDNKLSESLGDDAKSNGGSGKSLTGKVLKWIWRYNVSFSGRNPLLTKNPHIYDKVTRHTDMIIVDDCYEFLDFGFFYGDITGDMNPNPKQTQSYSIAFDESPKFWFDSNFGDRDFSESTQRRKLVTSFSDYYHENNGAYLETRQPTDDFDGKRLFYDFGPQDWNNLYNFLAWCLHFYLSCPEKVKPPMNNIQKRNLLSSMGNRFFEWAEVYFGVESKRLDKIISKRVAKDDYTNSEKIRDLSTQKFTDYCKKYAAYHGYEFNPAEYLNTQGRILREIDGVREEGIFFGTKKIDPEPAAAPGPGKPPVTNPTLFPGTPQDDEMPF
ncbi:hypothetical protein [Dyadobacter diqingensis]|uniref:hypothetical protein n=1 Tax=Dyadobacter diqingensis TaxID=2938121 RepID=UPI0020C552BD|nr:hypothetical protein [Dyadobacter diqingensis]